MRADRQALRAFSADGKGRSLVGGWFDAFPDDQLDALAQRVDRVVRPAGAGVREPSDHGAWFLFAGEVQASYLAADGRLVDLGRFGPGTLFGDLALLLDVPEPVRLVATVETHLGRLDPAEFWRWTESGDAAAVQFHRLLARGLARRLRFANQKMAENPAPVDQTTLI
jgi:CRP-like cAMP-binding protein